MGDEVDDASAPSDAPGDDSKDAGSDGAPEAVLAASSFWITFSATSDVSADKISSEKKLVILTDVF